MAHKHILSLLSLSLIMPTAYGMTDLLERQREDKALPIVLVHGLKNDSSSLKDTVALLQSLVPGTPILTPDIGFYGFAPCQAQVEELTNFINSKSELNDGFNLIGYSLGGLIARATLEEGKIPRAYSLVTLASPHRGVCGFPGEWDEQVDDYAQKLGVKPMLALEKLAHKVMYLSAPSLSFSGPTKAVSNLVSAFPRPAVSSVVDIWNEPGEQKRYLKYNAFLPYVNNEKSHKNDAAFRHNLTTAVAFLALSGTRDTTVEPWQSTRFDYCNADRTKILPLEGSPIYTELGLANLGSKFKRVNINTTHGSIHKGEDTFVQHVVPALTRESEKEIDAGNVYEEATTSCWRSCMCCK